MSELKLTANSRLDRRLLSSFHSVDHRLIVEKLLTVFGVLSGAIGRWLMTSKKHLRTGRAPIPRWRAVFLQCVLFLSSTYAQEAVVYLDSLQQVIRGFGAANIRPWRPDMTATEIQNAFGTGPGQVGLNILRLRVPPQSSEFALNVPTAQSAHALGVTVIASPWSPPAWMKKNNNVNGGGDPSMNRLYDTSYASYAAHLKSFVDYMASHGVPLHAVSVQNEPDWNATYESCLWSASEMVKFVKEYGASVGARLIAPESLNFNPTIANALLNDSIAAKNVAIIGGHLYGGGLVPYPLAAQMGKELWMTEHLDTNRTWPAVLATGKEIHDVLSAGMNAYIWWYIVRFYGPIDDGERGGIKGTVTKRGYVMSQFARFIRPGYVRVHTTIPRGSVYVTAYKPVLSGSLSNSKFVLVAVNMGLSTERGFRIQGMASGITTVKVYVTSRTKNCEQQSDITVSNGLFTATLPDSSVTTFVGDVTTRADGVSEIPHSFSLYQNYPNPFNPLTVIRFDVPVASRVSLDVFDMLGRKVATLLDGEVPAGYHETKWNAQDVVSGIYFYRLEASATGVPQLSFVTTRKMLLLR